MVRGLTGLCLLVALLLTSPVALCGEPAPPPAGGGEAGGAGVPEITIDEAGCVNVVNHASRCRLNLPAPYWECKTPAEMVAQSQGGGCTPAAGPPGLIFVIRNKDAPAVVTLRVLPQRFLMRGKEDMDGYLSAQEGLLKEKGGGTLEFRERAYGETEGVVTHRCVFDAKGSGPTQIYMLVHYFVRPAGEDATIYQVAAMTLDDAYAEQREDLDHIVESFRFTGQLAPAFFEPDAPAEKLPLPVDDSPAPSVCGLQSSGLLLAIGAIVLMYLYMKRRASRQAA